MVKYRKYLVRKKVRVIVLTVIFTIIFIIGIYYLIGNLTRLTKAMNASKAAIYPTTQSEFRGIVIPNEWKEMQPLTKETKSYRLVKWGTVAVIGCMSILLVLIITTDWFRSSSLSVVYIFFVLINSIRHPGSFFILPKGIVLNGKFYHSLQIRHYKTEQIVRWHSLYGLDDKVNNAFKVSFMIKRTLFQPQFIVVQTAEQLEQIRSLLKTQGVNEILQLPD
ncbi:hypothetical protein [Bacillus rubiinfantis]|uniref:hypothetical protein n=1 Tax=Bacillus rubiinfantis TaxID=1499680 RepID=UPI0005A873F8|nr:hypothetical protein [Bacillus rubiinfantis]